MPERQWIAMVYSCNLAASMEGVYSCNLAERRWMVMVHVCNLSERRWMSGYQIRTQYVCTLECNYDRCRSSMFGCSAFTIHHGSAMHVDEHTYHRRSTTDHGLSTTDVILYDQSCFIDGLSTTDHRVSTTDHGIVTPIDNRPIIIYSCGMI